MDQTSDTPPWEAISPELTDVRLRNLARLVSDARFQKMATRTAADLAWNLGCDAFAWQQHAIREAAEGPCKDWLLVPTKKGDLDFIFLVGSPNGVPVKFYRSDAQGQPERTLRRTHDEVHHIQGCFALNIGSLAKRVTRLAIETDENGLATEITLVQFDADERDVLYAWPIPIDGTPVLSLHEASRPAGVELKKAEVALPEDHVAAKREARRAERPGA